MHASVKFIPNLNTTIPRPITISYVYLFSCVISSQINTQCCCYLLFRTRCDLTPPCQTMIKLKLIVSKFCNLYPQGRSQIVNNQFSNIKVVKVVLLFIFLLKSFAAVTQTREAKFNQSEDPIPDRRWTCIVLMRCLTTKLKSTSCDMFCRFRTGADAYLISFLDFRMSVWKNDIYKYNIHLSAPK